MELTHLISIVVATAAGIATVGKAWTSINARQEAAEVRIAHMQKDVDRIPHNDPSLFRSVQDCHDQMANCSISTDMHVLQQSLAEVVQSHNKGEVQAREHRQFIEKEVRKITSSIVRLETQIDERTEKRIV